MWALSDSLLLEEVNQNTKVTSILLRLESYLSLQTGKGGRYYRVIENMGREEERSLEFRQGRVGSASAL